MVELGRTAVLAAKGKGTQGPPGRLLPFQRLAELRRHRQRQAPDASAGRDMQFLLRWPHRLPQWRGPVTCGLPYPGHPRWTPSDASCASSNRDVPGPSCIRSSSGPSTPSSSRTTLARSAFELGRVGARTWTDAYGPVLRSGLTAMVVPPPARLGPPSASDYRPQLRRITDRIEATVARVVEPASPSRPPISGQKAIAKSVTGSYPRTRNRVRRSAHQADQVFALRCPGCVYVIWAIRTWIGADLPSSAAATLRAATREGCSARVLVGYEDA